MKHIKTIGEYHDPNFYFQEVVRRQVEREAWVDWATKPTPEQTVVLGLTPHKPLTEVAKHVIYGSIRGFLHP